MNTANIMDGTLLPASVNKPPESPAQNVSKSKINQKKEDKAAWFKLFAELDPLANPDSLLGSNNNQSHAA